MIKFLVLLFLSVFFMMFSCDTTEKNNSARIRESGAFDIIEKKFVKNTETYHVLAHIPLLERSAEHENADQINDHIIKLLTHEIKQFQKHAFIVCQRDVENSPMLPSFWSDYRVFENSDSLLSLRIRIYADYYMNANPSLYYVTLNYDKTKNKEINPRNIILRFFENEKKATFVLTKLCGEKLYLEGDLDCNIFWKQTKDFEIFTNVNLSGKGLYFIFDDYSLDSHSCGNPQVYITFEEIKKSVKE